MNTIRQILIRLVVLAPLAALAQSSNSPLTAEQLFEELDLTETEKAALLEDAIISAGMPELEQTKKELVASSLMVIHLPMGEVVSELRAESSLQFGDRILAAWEINDETIFQNVDFGPTESAEIGKLANAQPGTDYNLSPEEIERLGQTVKDLQQGRSPYGNEAEAVISTYRDILLERYQAYRGQGLGGVAPYARKKGRLESPAEEFTLAIDSMRILAEYFPDFHRTLRDYPRAGHEFFHRFFLVKKQLQKRPAYVLTHRILDVGDGYALMAEQQFYIGHTLNSLQVLMAWLPYEDKTFVGLVTRTSTEKVSGAGSKLARKVGRSRVQQQIEPFFLEMRDRMYEDDPPLRTTPL